MQLPGFVKAKLCIKIERLLALEWCTGAVNSARNARRAMDRPRIPRRFNCLSPLLEAGFFTNVDFLTASDEPDHNTPLGDAVRESHKLFRFGLHVIDVVL